MIIKGFIFIVFLLMISCSNYKATNPFFSEESGENTNIPETNEPISNIPENPDPKYFIKSDYKEAEIEFIMQEYFRENNAYIIFLQDTKENINKNSTIIETINTIIKKDQYIKGVSLDLSRAEIAELKDNAFKDNNNLVHVKLPDTITTIGASAFSECSLLKTINFPSSITEIKDGAFKSCKSLYSVDLQNTKITIVNQQAFYDCSILTIVTLPETITAGIDASAFNSCSSLMQINIPSKLNAIGDAAFYDCKLLKNIKLNENITMINTMAFYNCISLENINLPKTLTSIGDRVFSGCSALKDIEYAGDKSSAITSVGTDILDAKSGSKNLYLPNVQSDDGSWNNFLNYDWKANGSIIFGKSMP